MIKKLFSRNILILWQLPQLMLALIIYIFIKKRITGVKVYKNSRVYLVKNFPGGISLSYMIFLNDEDAADKHAVKHEYGHCIQSLYFGWFYLLFIGFPSMLRVIIWNIFKLDSKRYYMGYPENWADRLGRRV